MTGWTRIFLLAAVLLALGSLGAWQYAAVDAHEIGRTDPQRAARYRLPFFNFSATYRDGAALGVVLGSTRLQAIRSAESAGFVVSPSCWGDNRAGGAGLYSRPHLLQTMLLQPHLCFNDPHNLKRGMIVEFLGDRVDAVKVHYINFEAV